MKRLITIGMLALTFGFSSFSFAESHVFGVKIPIVKSVVKDEIRGREVERDFIGFYITPKVANSLSSPTGTGKSAEDYSSNVFGVSVKNVPRT